jgi:putative peptide zinc metalloprotease protein
MSDRPTFSPFWHRVRQMKPRLRPHVEITRQRYRGRRWYVVHDPASNQFYRLNPVANDLVGMLDGHRDVETAWKVSLAKFGDAAPTQNEVIQLLTQLYSSNLLSVDATPETEQLLNRGRERRKRKATQQAIGIMYFRIKVFNPDRMLAAIEPMLRPIINRWGFLVWLAFVGTSLVALIPHWHRLVAQFHQLTGNPMEWLWVMAVFVVTKAIHETGHGVICKRFGGQVPEFGFMLLVLFPSPYVDASAAWGFASKWQRMAVGAGGMLFELFVAAISAWVWMGAPEGSVTSQVAYSALLTASFSTVVFNANPLMRFDGYYILADLLETPNLAQRAMQMVQYPFQKWVYGMERPTLPSTQRSEQIILGVYGVLSLAYRLFLFVTITLFVMGKFFALGLILAVWTAAAWFMVPTGKFIHWLATSPGLGDKRARAIWSSVAMAAACVVGLGLIRAPDYRRAEGIIESTRRSGVFFGVDGFVAQVHKRPGEAVKADDPIVTIENLEIVQERRRIEASVDELEARERQAMRDNEPAVALVARQKVQVYRETLEELDKRIGKLVVRAPHDGVLTGTDASKLLGAYVRRGDQAGEVVDVTNVRIAAAVSQPDAAVLADPRWKWREVKLRRYSSPGADRIMLGENVRVMPAGRPEIEHAALGYGGGGKIEIDPSDRSGVRTRRPVFTVYIDPVRPEGMEQAQAGWAGLPGERVKVLFELPPRPLMVQWADRLAKAIQGRAQI